MTENEVQNLSKDEKRVFADRIKARSISNTILDFGVTDGQIRELIKLLALELEDRDAMVKIFEFLGSSEESQKDEVKIYT